MIAAVEGILESRSPGSVVVRLGGMSLSVFVPVSTLGKLGAAGDRVKLRTHLHVREDNIALYGFASVEELDLFEDLISVSGFGPKSALALLSSLPVNEIIGAIVNGDTELLTRVPGIGKKTADRLILELRTRFEKELKGIAVGSGAPGNDSAAVIAALHSLGYTLREANQVVQTLPADPEATLEERVKQALRKMA